MNSEEDVCDAGPEALVYSLQMEWLGLDGRTYVNNSVRIEWTEGDSRAVCEMPKKLSDGEFSSQEMDISGHCSRCLVQVFAFAALILLLLKGLGVQTARPVTFPVPGLSVQTCHEVPKRTSASELLSVSRRSLSAAAVLQSCFTRPFLKTSVQQLVVCHNQYGIEPQPQCYIRQLTHEFCSAIGSLCCMENSPALET
ncbi:hypothetical protein J6590_072806 [Homalodisca vitripennis]|nr:hypothetical protein J6590_072806 [Homalodisca vitripennis]